MLGWGKICTNSWIGTGSYVELQSPLTVGRNEIRVMACLFLGFIVGKILSQRDTYSDYYKNHNFRYRQLRIDHAPALKTAGCFALQCNVVNLLYVGESVV